MTATIIPFIEPDPKCSFCNTPKSLSKKFVQSATGRNICGVCILHSLKRINEDKAKHDNPA